MKANFFIKQSSLKYLSIGVFLMVHSVVAIQCATAQREGGFVARLGSESCSWERNRPNGFFHIGSNMPRTPEYCEQYAQERGDPYVGSGDNAWIAASDVPDTPCSCDDTVVKWFFYPPYADVEHLNPCVGIEHSCTHPGAGCRWFKDGYVIAENVTSAMECRAKAKECGNPYYGWNEENEASKIPECDCTCGEALTKWYFGTEDWQIICKGYKYRCLKPNIKAVEDLFRQYWKKSISP